ncbi:hypothetical protein [Stenotrophomonas maltophilia]|uniref:hypothetical protein n=1 Tax=Stenotrophomonas maltophilia TaxID=40324 RepID=UPI003BF8DEEA
MKFVIPIVLAVVIVGVLLMQGAGTDSKERLGWAACQLLADPQSQDFGEQTQVACRYVYEDYLPEKTASYKPGQDFRLKASEDEWRETYVQVNERLRKLNREPMRPLAELSNGWLKE